MPRPSSRVDKGEDAIPLVGSGSTSDGGPTPPPAPSSFQSVATAQQARALSKKNKGNATLLQAGLEISSEHDPELQKLEKRLTEEVDEDFFEEPRRFQTLPRVIDVLGVQMVDDATAVDVNIKSLPKNKVYQSLQAQQAVVEQAIEHLAVIHCADLNASVIQVGRVARQFNDAVDKVRNLRKSVREIQDSLGPNQQQQHNSNAANPNEARGGAGKQAATAGQQTQQSNTAAMSLRELWLKKLECEATLSMLDKLDVIRAASAKFDSLLKVARIGAATLTVSQALDTMFRDDVAQVQALHKIMEQLMLRKQTAEEVVWDTLQNVVFLRTGNGLATSSATSKKSLLKNKQDDTLVSSAAAASASSSQSVSSESRRSESAVNKGGDKGGSGAGGTLTADSQFVVAHGMVNPFVTKHFSFATPGEDDDLFDLVTINHHHDDDTVASDHSNASLFSIEGDAEDESAMGGGGEKNKEGGVMATVISAATAAANLLIGKNAKQVKRRLTIPVHMIEAELDLEQDERRLQEDIALAGMDVVHMHLSQRSHHRLLLPRYADPVMALRILVECLARLKRLDDVERNLQEHAEYEIKCLVQREQARTFARLEARRIRAQTKSSIIRLSSNKADNLKDFRRHLTGLFSAFGSVLLRLSHLAQILRFRIASDHSLMQKIESPNSVIRSVITYCQDLMQGEIKAFLQACLKEPERTLETSLESAAHVKSEVGGFFSLGVLKNESDKDQDNANHGRTATRSNVMEMPTSRFVSSVLFSSTKATPQMRHALVFRRMVARWTQETESLKFEVAKVTGESLAALQNNRGVVDALTYLDGLIQKDLLPVMQEEAVDGTVLGLERRDGFDPVLDRAVYRPGAGDEALQVDMCIACQSVYLSTGPLFDALHRLPRGGEMYQPVVAVLEHVMLTFLSRIKQQVAKLCENKTALSLLENSNGKPSQLAQIMERRAPFVKLLQAYTDGDILEAAKAASSGGNNDGKSKLDPPTTDTAPRNDGDVADDVIPEITAEGVEAEEMIMELELKTLEPWLDFSNEAKIALIKICSDEELMKAETLAHSLLKVASLLEDRLKVRSSSHILNHKPLTHTRQLRESIKSVLLSGLKMAKFCRLDMLFQTVIRLAKVAKSSTLVARDAVRIPSSVNDLGEYMTGASDNLREAAGHAVTAYTFSSLEQYIPYCLMQTVRLVAEGKGIIKKAPLTMNGIEALDRSGSVLYRDLKGATAFDGSFWDVDLAALSFERSASFMAMMELEMEELVAYYNANQADFSEQDFILMFSMDGPRRKGDVSRFHMMKKKQRPSGRR